MTAFDLGHGQFHDQHLIAVSIVFYRALAENLRGGVVWRYRFNLPAGWPGDAWRVGQRGACHQRQTQEDKQRFIRSDHNEGHSRAELQSLSLPRPPGKPAVRVW